MKKCFLLIILILFFFINIFGNEKIIKRTIVILPFNNLAQIEKYNYISDMIQSNLKRDLEGHFIIEFEEINAVIKELGYENNRIFNSNDADSIALKLEADVVVFGDYIIEEQKILFIINSFDVITQEVFLNISINGEIGFDLSRYINAATQEACAKMSEQLTTYNSKLIAKFLSRDNAEIERKNIIYNLLDQTDKYWNLIVKRAKSKKMLLIPFPVLVFSFLQKLLGKIEIR